MEDDIFDFDDTNEVAHLVLMADLPDALVNHQHTLDTALVILWPCVTNLFARVEESSHRGANGSYAAEESFLGHDSLILWYSTYEILP